MRERTEAKTKSEIKAKVNQENKIRKDSRRRDKTWTRPRKEFSLQSNFWGTK